MPKTSEIQRSENKTSKTMDDVMKAQERLAESTAKNALFQSQLEFKKSMAEMHAKSTKSSGETLKGLA